MTSMFSYLITMFGGMFWLLRLVIALAYTMNWNFPIQPLNFITEIILLFLTLICMIFIIKRNIIGALVYFVAYGLYFGTDLFNGVMNIINGQPIVSDYLTLFVSFLGVLIPFLTVMDIFLNKDRTGTGKDKKTDWFYKNKDYDRQYDDRADRNQYKF